MGACVSSVMESIKAATAAGGGGGSGGDAKDGKSKSDEKADATAAVVVVTAPTAKTEAIEAELAKQQAAAGDKAAKQSAAELEAARAAAAAAAEAKKKFIISLLNQAEADVDRQLTEQYYAWLEAAQKGVAVLKYTHKKEPQHRTIKLVFPPHAKTAVATHAVPLYTSGGAIIPQTIAGGVISWNKSSDMKLSDVTHIRTGKTTALFAGVSDGLAAPTECFSVICDERSLDIQCRHTDHRNEWVRGLRRLFGHDPLPHDLAFAQSLVQKRLQDLLRENKIDENDIVAERVRVVLHQDQDGARSPSEKYVVLSNGKRVLRKPGMRDGDDDPEDGDVKKKSLPRNKSFSKSQGGLDDDLDDPNEKDPEVLAERELERKRREMRREMEVDLEMSKTREHSRIDSRKRDRKNQHDGGSDSDNDTPHHHHDADEEDDEPASVALARKNKGIAVPAAGATGATAPPNGVAKPVAASSAVATPQVPVVPDVPLLQVLNEMIRGVEFTKHGRSGKPHASVVRFNPQKMKLVYGTSFIRFSTVIAVRSGFESDVLKRFVAESPPALNAAAAVAARCLTLILTQSRTLDLMVPLTVTDTVAASATRDRWHRGLQLIIANPTASAEELMQLATNADKPIVVAAAATATAASAKSAPSVPANGSGGAAVGRSDNNKSATLAPAAAAAAVVTSAAADNQISAAQFDLFAAAGQILLKHGRKPGKPHSKRLTLSAAPHPKTPALGRVLNWESDTATVSEITGVSAGPQSDVMQRVVKEAKTAAGGAATALDEFCLFTVELKGRTLDLQAPDRAHAERWVYHLIRVCKEFRANKEHTAPSATKK